MRFIWALVAVTVVAGALRAGVALHPNPYLSADEAGYTNVALRLAETGRYGRDALHWPPGAPVAFAAAIRVGGLSAAYWVQWLAATALIPLVWFVAGGAWRGLVAAAIVATYPPLVVVGGDLLSEPLGALWLTATFAALEWDRRRRAGTPRVGVGAARGGVGAARGGVGAARGGVGAARGGVGAARMGAARMGAARMGAVRASAARVWAARVDGATLRGVVPLIVAGVCLAAAVLTRANLLVLVPVLAVALGRRGVVFAVAVLVPVGAWCLNASVPISNGGGSSFFVGTYLPGHGTLPGAKVALTGSRRASGAAVLNAVAARHPELDRDAALRKEGWANLRAAREQPGAYAEMLAEKPVRMWLGLSPRSDALRTPWLRLWHLLIVLGALAGLRDRRMLAALLAFAAFHLVMEAMPRYALPMLPVLIAGGCAGWRLPRRLAVRSWSPGRRAASSPS